MNLQFPNARLLAYERLTEGASCESVLVQSIADAGLISPDVASGLMHRMGKSSGCGSMLAARTIIEAYMAQHHDEENALKHAEKVFLQIQGELDACKGTAGDLHGEECKEKEMGVPCRDLAPIVLDLLLQQLLRH